MSEQQKIIPLRKTGVEPASDNGRLAVTLTVAEIKTLVAEIVRREASGSYFHLLSPETLAKRLSVPVSWVYEQSWLGNIPTHRIGKYIRFSIREVIESEALRNRS